MRKSALMAMLASMLLPACFMATSREVILPDGKPGFVIDCGGNNRDWGMCLEESGKLCGSAGYEILDKIEEQASAISGNMYGTYGGVFMKRSLFIRCKGDPILKKDSDHKAPGRPF